ncbi:hypothetical protein [Egicoccus halophilus]|uniref:DUF4157 domain-containing protein n=1 Tax=Egicoccus halophilus TaxID=1670830 RepID=A0A8J3A6B8_9ACTN|nr:hypothetical protein [Egicoccus halophilus]GGI04349.1 hypothetical protein GCM10011354_08650 [Egicoccus halophilus]
MIRRLLWAAVLATLGAGVVGALRQRREVVLATRARSRPVAGTATAAPATTPPRQGPLGRRLAGWVPAQPRTRAGQLAALAWASPLTAVGLLVAVVSGGRPRWRDDLGCFVTEQVQGASAFALRLVGAEANAIGHVVLSRQATASPALLAHEAVHVRQAERLGPLLFPVYLWLSARYGYRHHPMEQAARRGARQAIDDAPTG